MFDKLPGNGLTLILIFILPDPMILCVVITRKFESQFESQFESTIVMQCPRRNQLYSSSSEGFGKV